QPGLVEEPRHPVRWLRADRQPMLDPLGVEHDALRVAVGQHRAVGAQPLDEAAVARVAAVLGDDAVERLLLGAAAAHADLDGHRKLPFAGSSSRSSRGGLMRNQRRCNRLARPPRIIPFSPMRLTFFIIDAIWMYCFSSRLTSCTEVPD